MNHSIIEGAHVENWESTAEYGPRLRALRQSIETKYAARLATAGLLRRLLLRFRIHSEYHRERKKIIPSDQSLYSEG
jgi:hypothetical protein